MKDEKRILIIGAGGQGQVLAELLFAIQAAGGDVVPIGYLDDNPKLIGQFFTELPVIGDVDKLQTIRHDAVIIAFGDNKTRHRIYNKLLHQGEHFVTPCHPQSLIALNVDIGPGSVVEAGAIIKTGSRIGANVIVNSGSGVGHHNLIEDHGHIGPGARLGADVIVGEGVLIGIGAIVIPNCNVGRWSIIGAGAVVIQDIPAYTTAVGVPAKVISKRYSDNH